MERPIERLNPKELPVFEIFFVIFDIDFSIIAVEKWS